MKLRIQLSSTLLLATTGVLLTGNLFGGDPEHFCTAGVEYVEAWPNFANVTWTLSHGIPTVQRVAPGFPKMYTNGTPAQICPYSPNLQDHPGFQSFARAISAWNAACTSGGRCTTFALSTLPNPTTVPGGGFGGASLFSPTDLINIVSLYEPSSTFAGAGGPLAIARTAVTMNATFTSGVITDADIGFQAEADVAGNVFWSFVETNDVLGMSFATDPLGTGQYPINGFADLQGVAAHEFGHFAGLGHSLLDSTASLTGSQFPTMFDSAQAEPMKVTVRRPPITMDCAVGSSFVNWPQQVLDTTLPFAGGMLGRSARTLTADDTQAIVNAYPPPFTPTTSGSIRGTVFNYNGVAQAGAHVVVCLAGQPDKSSIGTFTYGNGTYRFDGLAAGSYYVYAEWPDMDPAGGAGGAANDFYLNTATLPNFIFPGFFPGGGCVAPLGFFPYPPMDYFDASEASLSEFSQTTATAIAVTAGTLTVADIRWNFTNHTLTVRDDLSPAIPQRPSPRGVVLLPSALNPGVLRSVTFTIQAPPGVPSGTTVSLFLDDKRLGALDSGQMRLVQGAPSTTAIPGVRTGVISGSTCSITVPMRRPEVFKNVFAQAVMEVPSGNVWTNPVNVWVQTP